MISEGSHKYIQTAIEGESAGVARAQSSTRNYALNRAAFKLGTIPNMSTDTAVGALLLASRTNGYLKEHCEPATSTVLQSGLRTGQANLRRPVRQESDTAHGKQTGIGNPATSTKYPNRTKPDAKGKPSFRLWGLAGPPVNSGEKRRHVYTVSSCA